MKHYRHLPHVEAGPLDNPILFENPLSGGTKAVIGLGVLAALGVGAYFFVQHVRAANAPASVAVTLAPGSSTLHGFKSFGEIVVGLPSGGVWQSLNLDGTPVNVTSSGGVAPITLSPSGSSGTIAASWIDSTGALQSSTIAYGA